MSGELDSIVGARQGVAPIALAEIERWGQSQALEVLGALYHSITDPRFWGRIDPAPSMEWCQEFGRLYFGRCLREDPTGEWCDSRYSAGLALSGWLSDLVNRGDPGVAALHGWMEWVADLYRSGDAELRRAIVDATLEHLFENRRMAKLFSDWRADPELRVAYDEAMEWSRRGGKLPRPLP